MKKIRLFVVTISLLFISALNVYADYWIKLSFMAEGGTTNSNNVKIVDNVVFVKNKKGNLETDAVYSSTDTIKTLNSIDGVKFSLNYKNKEQTKGAEWYSYHDQTAKKIYFDQSKKYKISKFVDMLGMKPENGKTYNVYLYANWKKVSKSKETSKVTFSDVSVTKGPISQNIEIEHQAFYNDGHIVFVGEKPVISMKAFDKNKKEIAINWTSSNKDVATIAKNGTVTPKKTGKVFFTAEANGVTKKIKFYIFAVNLGKKNLKLEVGKTTNVNISVLDEYGDVISAKLNNLKLKEPLNLANYANVSLKSNKVKITAKNPTSKAMPINVNLQNTSVGAINLEVNNNSAHNGAIYFLRTSAQSLAILLRSSDEKYALLDTSYDGNDGYCNKIVSEMQKALGKKSNEKIELSYLILSHSHLDHVGCATSLLKNSMVSIDTILMKKESINTKLFNKIKNNKSAKTNLIQLNSGDNSSTGYRDFSLGTMRLYLFNYGDVYANSRSKCLNSNGKRIHDTTGTYKTVVNVNSNNLKEFFKVGNQGIGFKTANATSLMKMDFVAGQKGSNGAYNNYYLRKADRPICGTNANSLATLVGVPINGNDYRYFYLPADLENNGASFEGEYYNIPGSVNNVQTLPNKKKANSVWFIHGTGAANPVDVKKLDKINAKTFNLPVKSNRVLKPMEILTALEVKKFLGKNLNKIVIYQASHHGINNDESAIQALNLNRNNIIVVAPRISSFSSTKRADTQRTYFYTLNNVRRSGNLYISGNLSSDMVSFSVLPNGTVQKGK